MFYTDTASGKSFIRHRAAMVGGWMSGALSSREAISLILPARISSGRGRFTAHYEDFLRSRSEREVSSFMDAEYPGIMGEIEGKDRLSLINQIFFKDEYGAKDFLKPDSVIISAGANIGVFSLFASVLCPRGKIFAFEPVRKTYGLLVSNTRHHPNVKAVNMALGDEEKEQEILTSAVNPGINSLVDSDPALKNKRLFDGSEKVKVTTIDAFVEREGLKKVDVIKMDAEGYERQILKGACRTIAKYKPTITMSAYHRTDDRIELPRLLKEICPEYSCRLLHRSEEDMVCSVTS